MLIELLQTVASIHFHANRVQKVDGEPLLSEKTASGAPRHTGYAETHAGYSVTNVDYVVGTEGYEFTAEDGAVSCRWEDSDGEMR